MKKVKQKNIKQFIRVGTGSYRLIKNSNIKGLFYYQSNDGKIILLDNSKGRMNEVQFDNLENCMNNMINKA
ncbi:hypothetical protein AALA22_13110 [Anaerovoracaceae bacterium 41-7]